MATGAITSVVWSAINLPDGLSINASTGVISGTPTTPGTYTPVITVTTNWGSDTKAITINVAIPEGWMPVITPNQVIDAVAGEAMTAYQVTGTNVTKTA
ncbi:MAG: putative Ig domain-containing protein [Synergistaceae bacterium]|nr:putative Ig domain-containing protein [Synergistaceae bacterium]